MPLYLCTDVVQKEPGTPYRQEIPNDIRKGSNMFS